MELVFDGKLLLGGVAHRIEIRDQRTDPPPLNRVNLTLVPGDALRTLLMIF